MYRYTLHYVGVMKGLVYMMMRRRWEVAHTYIHRIYIPAFPKTFTSYGMVFIIYILCISFFIIVPCIYIYIYIMHFLFHYSAMYFAYRIIKNMPPAQTSWKHQLEYGYYTIWSEGFGKSWYVYSVYVCVPLHTFSSSSCIPSDDLKVYQTKGLKPG